jgi:hypothetical protein
LWIFGLLTFYPKTTTTMKSGERYMSFQYDEAPQGSQHAEDHTPSIDHVLSALDGDVNSQGVRIGHRDWLDMGSEGFANTPEKVKAAAFQAATTVGAWEIERLKSLMVKRYPHITQHIMETAINILQSLAEQHPFVTETVQESEVAVTDVKVKKWKADKTDADNPS